MGGETIEGWDEPRLAALFGVPRQTVSRWLESDEPTHNTFKLNAIAQLASILERNLKRERIPDVVREPAETHGGLNILEMIECDRHNELLTRVEASFDWRNTAPT